MAPTLSSWPRLSSLCPEGIWEISREGRKETALSWCQLGRPIPRTGWASGIEGSGVVRTPGRRPSRPSAVEFIKNHTLLLGLVPGWHSKNRKHSGYREVFWGNYWQNDLNDHWTCLFSLRVKNSTSFTGCSVVSGPLQALLVLPTLPPLASPGFLCRGL